MISPWIDISEVSGQQWIRLVRLMFQMLPAQRSQAPLLLLFHEEKKVIRAILGRDPVQTGDHYPGPEILRDFLNRYHARRVVAIDAGALATLWMEIEGRFRYGEDLVDFGYHVHRSLRRMRGLGIDVFPPLRLTPLPPRPLLDVLFNLVWPDDTSVVFYLFEGACVFTSIIVSKKAGRVCRLTSDDALWEHRIDPGRWQKDVPRVRAEIERRFGPIWAGWFSERTAFERIVGKEMAIRDAEVGGELVRSPWPRRWRGLEMAMGGLSRR